MKLSIIVVLLLFSQLSAHADNLPAPLDLLSGGELKGFSPAQCGSVILPGEETASGYKDRALLGALLEVLFAGDVCEPVPDMDLSAERAVRSAL